MKRFGIVFGLLVLATSCQKEVFAPRTESGELCCGTHEALNKDAQIDDAYAIGSEDDSHQSSGANAVTIGGDGVTVLGDNGGITDPNHDPSSNKDRRKR